MSPTRREFLWTMGATAGAFAFLPMEQVFFSAEQAEDPGWSPGIERWIRSNCSICPACCGITGRVVDGRLVRIVGNPLDPVSRGGLCTRGLAGVQLQYHPQRLVSPQVQRGGRGSGTWEAITRDDAVALLADRLSQARADGRASGVIGVLGDAEGTTAELWRTFFKAYGSPNLVLADGADGSAAVMHAMHGIRRPPAYDLDQAEFVLSFGAPLFESWDAPTQAFSAFGRVDGDGPSRRRFVQVDHRFSRTAAHADEWVGVRARTHAILALGLAYVILRDRLYDEAFLDRWVSGFDDFTDETGMRREGFRSLVLERYRTEEVSALTGVPVDRITELARAFALSPAAVAICGSDVTRTPDGLSAGMAVHSLNVLTGRVNRPGGVVFGSPPPLTPLPAAVEDDIARRGGAEPPLAPPPAYGRGDGVTRLAQAIASGGTRIPVLLVHGADPLGTSHRSELWRTALDRVDLVVSFSPFLDETTRMADLVIPDLLPYERWGDGIAPPTYPYPVWNLVRPLVDAPEEGTATEDAVLAVARALGGTIAESLPYDDFASLLKERARGLFEARRGRSFANAFDLANQRNQEERGWWLPTQSDFDGFWTEVVDRGGWVDPLYDWHDRDNLARTPDGRIRLVPTDLVREFESRGGGVRLYGHGMSTESGGSEEFPLRLLPYRLFPRSAYPVSLQPWLAEQPAVLPDRQWIPFVVVAPATAAALQLTEDTLVRVVSAHGSMRARLALSPGAPPLTVCAPSGLSFPDGEAADPLRLLEPAEDALTGIPSWFTTFVRLEKAEGRVA